MNYKDIEILTLSQKNITDFATARNNLLKNVKKSWALFLDKDETVSKIELPDNPNFSCFQFKRKNFFLNQYVGEDKVIRLVKKGTGKWVRIVHEFWKPKIGSVGKINTPIVHVTASNLTDYISKINVYSNLHAEANKREGKKSTIFKIIFYPQLKFIQTLIKSKNVAFSIMQAFHSFLSWSKLYLSYYS